MHGNSVRVALVFLISSLPLRDGLAVSFDRKDAPSDVETVEHTDKSQLSVVPTDEGAVGFESSIQVAGPDQLPNKEILFRHRLASVSPLLDGIGFSNSPSDIERLPEVNTPGLGGSVQQVPYAKASQNPRSGTRASNLDSGRDGSLPSSSKGSDLATLPPATWVLPTLACLVAFVLRSARARV